jgi:hypothetical protein
MDGVKHALIGLDCVCQPESVPFGDTALVFHNHLDGKEEHEWLVKDNFGLNKETDEGHVGSVG